MEMKVLLQAGGGVIACRDHRHLKRALSRQAAAGTLVRVLRGIYVAAGTENDPGVLVRAVQTAYPDAIFTGATAAWLRQMVDRPPAEITAMHPGRSMATGRIRLAHGRLDQELWQERSDGLRIMTGVMTALDVIPTMGAKLVDQLMSRIRGGAQSAAQLLRRFRSALATTPKRPGNQLRRRVLGRTSTNPWSEAERILHELLEAAGITGWTANHGVELGSGGYAVPDVAFGDHLLAIEVDGYEFHSSRSAFQTDRSRGNLLLLSGWRVLHFTWEDLNSHPDLVIAQIREALGQRVTLCG